ncbi:MAG: thioredoxin family protein [Campylobacterota bacterium]|nr:thioredoxin family protein [Campylobacterota bacterium]
MKKLIRLFFLLGVLSSTTLLAQDIIWVKDINTAFTLAKKEQKNVMLMVEGMNCRWCVKMKQRTLLDKEVREKLKSYILVKVMREDKEAVKDLPEIHGVPSIFFITPKKKIIESVIGYFNIEDFLSYISDVEKKSQSKSI